jgi:hypothetical protein
VSDQSCPRTDRRHWSLAMSRYLAPLGFTLAATWVATIFVLVTAR